MWTLRHLLEVLDSFVSSNPYQQQMLVQSWGTSLSVSAHIVSHQIDILYHSPQWSAPLPHIPRNMCHHHWKYKWGSLLIPCWLFRMKVKAEDHWGVVCGFDLCLFGLRRCLPKHDICIVWRGVWRRIMVVGWWRNTGWGSTIRMKTKTLHYLMLKVHDVEFHSMLFCLVPFNLVFQIMQGLRKKMVVSLTHKTSKFRKRKHRYRSSSWHVDSLTVFSKGL